MNEDISVWVQIATNAAIVVGVAWNIYETTQAHRSVKQIEHQTNAMKDELVAVTKLAAGLEGEERGKQSILSGMAASSAAEPKPPDQT